MICLTEIQNGFDYSFDKLADPTLLWLKNSCSCEFSLRTAFRLLVDAEDDNLCRGSISSPTVTYTTTQYTRSTLIFGNQFKLTMASFNHQRQKEFPDLLGPRLEMLLDLMAA